jgi:hypothetical protein
VREDRPPLGGTRPDGNFAEGTSPHGRVFSDAGLDPNLATSKPIRDQVQIIRTQMMRQFGFKDVTVNPRSHPKEVRDQLASFYNSAMEMSHVLGMPYEAIGLNGRFSFTTKPYVSPKQALGSYQPGNRTITIPGRSNSFAHEWTHALDHYLADRLANNPNAMKLLSETRPLATQGMVGGRKIQPGSTAEAFVNVLHAIYGKDAATAQEALRLQFAPKTPANEARLAAIQSRFSEGARGSGNAKYYNSPVEMLARSHEAYVGEAIRAQEGGDATGVAKPFYDSVQAGDTFERLYPQQAERDAIFLAYRDLHDQIRAGAILGQGQGVRPGTLGMVDQANWHKLANVDANPGFVAKLKREVQAVRNPLDTMRERAGINPDAADPGHRTLRVRAMDSSYAVFASTRGVARRLADQQQSPGSKHAFTQIVDHLTPAEGKDVRSAEGAAKHYIGPTWGEQERRLPAQWTSQFVDILKTHGIVDRSTDKINLNHEQNLMLRHLLTEGRDDNFVRPGETTPVPASAIPQNYKDAAPHIRFLLNQVHDALKAAGVDLGYAESGYLPRIYDEMMITANREKFITQASELHRIEFDRSVNQDPALFMAQHDSLSAMQRGQLPQDVQDNVKTLRDNLNQQDKIQSQVEAGTHPDPVQAAADMARLQTDAQDLLTQLHDPVRDHVATTEATNWQQQVDLGNPADFDSAGPNASITRGRKLGPEADTIMRDFMVNDPVMAIARYFQQAGRKIADANAFGPKREKLEGWLKEAQAAGSRQEDIDQMRRIVETVTGRVKSGFPQPIERALNVIHAMGTVALMPRAVLSSLTEPMAIIAKTGNFKAAGQAFAGQIGDIIGTATSKDKRALAEAAGLVMSSLHDTILQDRNNAAYWDSPGLGKLMSYYYRTFGLTQLTNSQVTQVSTVAAHQAVAAWSKDFLGADKRLAHEAAAQFRAFGIPDKYQENFANWMLSKDGLPSINDLKSEGGQLWNQAVTRLTYQTIQVPYRVDRPLLSSNPVGRLMFGLMTFNYAFYHHIIEQPIAEHGARIGEAFQGVRDAGGGRMAATAATIPSVARAAAHISAAGAAIYAGALLSTMLRERIFNGDAWNRHEQDGTLEDWLMGLAISRSGVNGPMDPLINAMTGLRYNRDLSSLTAGAQVSYFLQSAAQMLSPATGFGSADTNTARYNATVGAYNMFAVPTAALAATVLPGGPFVRAGLGAAGMYLTSRGAADKVATSLAGPKGMKNDGTMPAGAAAGRMDPYARGETETEKPSQGSGTGAGMAPFSAADDVAAPMARVFMKLPGPLKVGAGVAAAGAGAAYLHGIYTRPQGAPY